MFNPHTGCRNVIRYKIYMVTDVLNFSGKLSQAKQPVHVSRG